MKNIPEPIDLATELLRRAKQRKAGSVTEHPPLDASGRNTVDPLRGLAHDLRNLFTVMFCHIDRIRKRHPDWEASADALDLAVRSAARIADAISCPSETDRGADLNAVTEDCLTLLRCLADCQGIDVTFSCHDGPLAVPLDRSSLVRIVMNLTMNAIDANRSGGAIHIRTRLAESGKVAELLVQDTGEGMTAEILRRALEPDFTTRNQAHSGLGLPTVEALLQSSGGSIQIESQPKEVTRVWVRLPLQGTPPAGPS